MCHLVIVANADGAYEACEWAQLTIDTGGICYLLTGVLLVVCCYTRDFGDSRCRFTDH